MRASFCLSRLEPIRRLVPDKARIADARPHDLRHLFASHAVLQGVPLPIVSHLLGHKRPSMTLSYAHVGDREIKAAAERIGAVIARELDGSMASSNAKLNTLALGFLSRFNEAGAKKPRN